jgi:hypothetical protein
MPICTVVHFLHHRSRACLYLIFELGTMLSSCEMISSACTSSDTLGFHTLFFFLLSLPFYFFSFLFLLFIGFFLFFLLLWYTYYNTGVLVQPRLLRRWSTVSIEFQPTSIHHSFQDLSIQGSQPCNTCLSYLLYHIRT